MPSLPQFDIYDNVSRWMILIAVVLVNSRNLGIDSAFFYYHIFVNVEIAKISSKQLGVPLLLKTSFPFLSKHNFIFYIEYRVLGCKCSYKTLGVISDVCILLDTLSEGIVYGSHKASLAAICIKQSFSVHVIKDLSSYWLVSNLCFAILLIQFVHQSWLLV